MQFDPYRIREHAMRFDKDRFKMEVKNFVAQNYDSRH